MLCKVCNSEAIPAFEHLVLGRFVAKYRQCHNCGFLFAENPDWLDLAYSRAIAVADTGLVSRNFSIGIRLAAALLPIFGRVSRGRFLDVAGGFGILTRFMRDFGYDFWWTDQYCENLIAPGFSYTGEVGPCIAVTAVEVLEHVTDPKKFIQDALAVSGARAFIFTTTLYVGRLPPNFDWDYYSFETGQHIGFFRQDTIRAIADSLGMRFCSANGVHFLTYDPVNRFIFSICTNKLICLPLALMCRFFLGSKTYADNRVMMLK